MTVQDYIEKLPDERKEAFNRLRETILKHLPSGFEECISYGMIGYVVPHSLYPKGYHCDPKLPLPMINLANQKNFIALYHMGVYANPDLLNWFVGEYPKHCKSKLDMGKACIRFKKMNDIPYDLIAELIAKVSVEKWIESYESAHTLNKILNIHYFDLITGYKRNPNYFLIGSKYGDNNDIDMFPQMMEKQVVSVGFASKLDLSAFYLTDENEIIEHLKDENENQNSINALKHFLSIKIGDKIAVKASGSPKGNKGFLSIVGICEVVQNEEGKVYSYDPNGLGHTLSVKYLEAPVYREYNLGGYGSTVHHLTKEEHIELIFENTKSLSIFEKVKSQFDKVIFDSFIDNLRNIIIQTNISKNDERVVFSVRDNRLNFTVGQRYCFNLYASDSRGVYGVISKTKLLENSESYDGTPPLPYYNYFTTFNPDSTEWNSIIDSIKEELLRTTKSGYKKYNNEDFENFVFSIEPIVNNNQMNFPINTILYGPPGTGKTYNTILRAAEIVENRVINSYDEALQIFKSKLHDQIEFITFHQNYSYEDFIQGLRPETENEGQLSFEKKDGLFKTISDKALKNLNSVNNSKSVQRDFDEVFNEFLKPVFEEGKEIEVKMIKSSFFITGTTKKSIEFRKNIGESVHSLSISTLRQMYNDQINNLIIGGLQPYYNPLMIKLLELGKSENIKVNSKNYVIIIDEINRANISRVFGELITLIEPDKRSHGKIPLEVRLPSGDSFIVPSNLYIIGTMNTADKSIALLDIALRRRFEFESMYPKYEIEGQDIFDVEILQKINEQIIKTKGHDFQIGHAYFMGENKDLIQRMNKKVIPLLLEYFMNDEKEVKGILFNAGLQIEENSWPIKISGKRA